ncbi:MAG: biotin--[acetyl-CoA-carboxylase] ligase [Clostridiales bacterium]|nr:biotin--[acetyl-CoA-carboxylase] ligase [Clostridiales bacterium]
MHKGLDENFNHKLSARIKEGLTGAATKAMLDIRDTVTSTNDIAKALAKAPKGVDEGYTIIASAQTKGRGTQGRSFYSPPDTGIYMSTILPSDISVDDLPHITPLCAVAVARAVEAVSHSECRIKWINDIFVRGRKICGILTEGAIGNHGRLNYAVVGIGINLAPTVFPDALKNTAGTLLKEMPSDLLSIKADTIAHVLNHLFSLLPDIKSRSYLDEYRQRSLLIGKKVTVLADDNSEKSGIVTGIDENAALCINLENECLITVKSSSQLLSYTL